MILAMWLGSCNHEIFFVCVRLGALLDFVPQTRSSPSEMPRRSFIILESLYSDNAVRILLKYCDDRSTEFWTEFALYGVFVQSRHEPLGHCFEERPDLVHFSFRQDFTHLLKDIEAQAPLMIKFNKRRPGRYDLGVDDYLQHVSEIKKAYQRRLELGAAR